MENYKKTMLISGTIGLGIGLLISGIVLSLLMYSLNKKNTPNITGNEQFKKENLAEKSQDIINHFEAETIKTNKIKEKPNKEEIIKEPEIVDTNHEIIKIEIDETATARQIAHLLEEEGIISDASEFLSYIISKNVSRKLIHGKKKFKINSDHAAVLEILMTYQ